MTHQTGCRKEPRPRSQHLRASKAFRAELVDLVDILQPIRIRNQQQTPSCVGQGVTAVFEGILGVNGSATQVWAGARRREGSLHDSGAGCYVSSAIDEVTERGIAPYRDGEEQDWASFVRRPALKDELAADDMRIAELADHHVVVGGLDEQRRAIVAALRSGRGVIWTTGVRDAFHTHPANVVVGDSEVGADYNGHAMRCCGYLADVDCLVIQNSWGKDWGGVVALGQQLRGCCLVPVELAVRAAWETWIIEARTV